MALRHVEHVMGTAFSFDVRGDDPEGTIEAALTDAVRALHQVDATFSTYRPDSTIERLARGEVRLGDCEADVATVFGLCAELEQETGGYFSARFRGRLDPTGIVKGWAAQAASDTLRAAGSRAHCVNGGGDVQTVGRPAAGRSWRIGIAHPLEPGALASVVEVVGLAVATSGSAERGAHVINPLTGLPATELASVTVVGPDLTRADAYATAAFAMGRRACAWLEGLPGYEALAISPDGSAWASEGFTGTRG